MKRVGILGNGQLGAMMAQAGRGIGIDCEFIGSEVTATCEGLGRQWIFGPDVRSSISHFARSFDVITYESENTDIDSLSGIPSKSIRPSVAALRVTQDRLFEKELANELGLETAKFQPVDSFDELVEASKKVGLPSILKTRTQGYDGKGQWRIQSERDLESLRTTVPWALNKFVVEGFVDFVREISVIGVRNSAGDVSTYSVTENQHHEGILRRSQVLFDDPVQEVADQIFKKVADRFDYVGVLAIELFDCDGRLVVNEMAPRVHNSGHWTIEGAVTSQFENHLRAICGMPLGSTVARSAAKMFNVIGLHCDSEKILNVKGAYLHDYGKVARPQRKLGHVTVVEIDCDDFVKSCSLVEQCLASKSS